ncbi:sulfatase [Paenibacillus hodogayensis]|uniref:Sulfatase n=1 Tax=Paenibacillus hodogayensis TaxID=279208 RepID=A0ABV5VWN8_9BACL
MTDARPNILLIMADQLRSDWLGCAGNAGVDTPHIDSLAARGVRFAKASCTSPVCAPSRASLASGLLPHRTGVLHNKHNYPRDCPTYYQALRGAGYRVGVVGKTDLHKADHDYGADGDLPLLYHFGFTQPHETEGKGNASKPAASSEAGEFRLAGPYQRYLRDKGLLEPFLDDRKRRSRQSVWHADPCPLDPADVHDSYIGRKACEWIERVNGDAPWHLFVSFVGPHNPWDAPESYACRYAEREYPESVGPEADGKPEAVRLRMEKQSRELTPEGLLRVKRHYAAAIRLIDDWVGQLLERIERKGLTDRTIVVFCADHGEMLGDHGLFLKTVHYEGALRVPLIVADPRRGHPGAVSDALVELNDLHPTMLDWAGAEYAASRLDGKSLLQVLTDPGRAHKAYQVSELLNSRMIADRSYKYIETYNDKPELYDLEADPGERTNVAEERPEVAARMLRMLKEACK